MVYKEHLVLVCKIPGMVSTLLQRFGDEQDLKLQWHLAACYEKQNQEVLCQSADFGRDLGDGDDSDADSDNNDDDDDGDEEENQFICQPQKIFVG